MNPFPLSLETLLGHWGQYIVYLIIGVGFGAILEMSGFGKSTKLAAQFYFKEMTVIKVMFGAIVVAMILIFLATGLGFLDFNLVWVNPTYLWSGIVGGLIMGAGFILGGFCPGTSLVAAVTLKLDGIVFVLGAMFGIFLFGETVGGFDQFYNAGYLGRFTLPELFGLDTGTMVVLIALMALGVFVFSEYMERRVGKLARQTFPRWRIALAPMLIVIALVTLGVGQPTMAARWTQIAPEKEKLLTERQVQVSSAELITVTTDPRFKVMLFDVRSESDYNQFHIRDARHIAPDDLLGQAKHWRQDFSNTAFILIGNDEVLPTELWKLLTAASVPNVYILEGGVNAWLEQFACAPPELEGVHFEAAPCKSKDFALRDKVEAGESRFVFTAALGEKYPFAAPSKEAIAGIAFEKKIKLAGKRGGSFGCG